MKRFIYRLGVSIKESGERAGYKKPYAKAVIKIGTTLTGLSCK